MMNRPQSRLAIDLDEFEAELAVNEPVNRDRPQFDDARLAELARIVGQEDRFRTLLAMPDRQRHPQQQETQPDWAHAPQSERYGEPETQRYAEPAADPYAQPHGAYGHAEPEPEHQYQAQDARWDEQADDGRGQYDRTEYDRADYDGAHYDRSAEHQYQSADDDGAYGREDLGQLPRRRSARPFYLIALGVAVVAAGSVGALALRGKGTSDGAGGTPMIKADTAPVKVQPPQDGSAADPTANKSIYDRVGQPASTNTKLVDAREEPVDVQQTVRQQQLAGASDRAEVGVSGAPPVATANRDPMSGLGQPRKVKTVAIRPDGTVIPESPPARPAVKAAAAVSPPAPARTEAPAAPPETTASVPTAGKQLARVAETRSDDSDSAPRMAGAPTSMAALTQRMAPATPQQVAAAPAAPAASADDDDEPAATPARRGGGAFAVQLAAPGSEQEAKTAFAGLKRRFPGQLGPFEPTIVRAQSGGRTVYRLRVAQLSRDEATKLCEKLKSAGGNCFVAK